MWLILVAFLSYSNGAKAKVKGLHPVLWGAITVGAFLAAVIIGFTFVVYNFLNDIVNLDQLSSQDAETRDAIAQQIVTALDKKPLQMTAIMLFGFGGYLLVRYIIERKPGKKEPEVHWMDKLGEDR